MSLQDTQTSWAKIQSAAEIITIEAKSIVDDPDNGMTETQMRTIRLLRRQWVALRDTALDPTDGMGGC